MRTLTAVGIVLCATSGLACANSGSARLPKSPAAPRNSDPHRQRVAAQVAAAVDERFGSRAEFVARFEEAWIPPGDNGNVERRSGVLIFRRASRVSLRFDDGSRIVSDGDRVMRFDARTGTMSARASACELTMAAFRFLRGDLRRQYRVRIMPPSDSRFHAGYALEAWPKGRSSVFEKLVLMVYRDSYDVERVLLKTPEGGWYRLKFSPVTAKIAVANDEFELKSPDRSTWVP